MNEEINAIEAEAVEDAEVPEPISHPFAEDTPASLYKELKDGERLILGATQDLFVMEDDVVRKHDVYEAAKNGTLKELFDEEREAGVTKRTELHRQAIYRLKHRELRREWQLALRDREAQKQYIESLLGIQTSLEARAKQMGIEERFAGSRYTT